jgi:hypothetical protein
MQNTSEIVDETFGKLFLVDESTYSAEIPWNRGVNISLFIHVDGENLRKSIEIVKNTFSLVRNNEMDLFSQGVKYLTSIGAVSKDEDLMESFLSDAAETSIEISSKGEGQIAYLVMMLGSIIIEFSHDGTFQKAKAIAG